MTARAWPCVIGAECRLGFFGDSVRGVSTIWLADWLDECLRLLGMLAVQCPSGARHPKGGRSSDKAQPSSRTLTLNS